MRRILLLVASFFVLSSSASASRPSVNVSECNITMPCDFANSQMRRARIASQRRNQQSLAPRAISHRTELAEVNGGRGKVVGGRSAGCPRSFCGCGASIRVFGRHRPWIEPASNWMRFPRTAPPPGMVAARRRHVFVLEQHVQGDT